MQMLRLPKLHEHIDFWHIKLSFFFYLLTSETRVESILYHEYSISKKKISQKFFLTLILTDKHWTVY